MQAGVICARFDSIHSLGTSGGGHPGPLTRHTTSLLLTLTFEAIISRTQPQYPALFLARPIRGALVCVCVCWGRVSLDWLPPMVSYSGNCPLPSSAFCPPHTRGCRRNMSLPFTGPWSQLGQQMSSRICIPRTASLVAAVRSGLHRHRGACSVPQEVHCSAGERVQPAEQSRRGRQGETGREGANGSELLIPVCVPVP